MIRDKTLRYFEGTPRAYEIDERKRKKAALKTQNALDKKKEHVRAVGFVWICALMRDLVDRDFHSPGYRIWETDGR